MTELENKILDIVDEDIRNIFINIGTQCFAIGLPIKMQIARSLKKLIPLLEK